MGVLMQAVVQERSNQSARAARIVLRVEHLAYIVLIALSLALRLAELDTVPLSDQEARRGLASWRFLHPEMPGEAITPNSHWPFCSTPCYFRRWGF
jgi:hypothetical protein